MSRTGVALILFVAAALFEIGGCYAFWAFAKLGKPASYLIPGVASLVLFATLLAKVDAPFAGRTYAAYGGIYIALAMLWMAVVERQRPDIWDVAGAAVCLAGAALILVGRPS